MAIMNVSPTQRVQWGYAVLRQPGHLPALSRYRRRPLTNRADPHGECLLFFDHSPRVLAMATAADTQMMGRLGNAEFSEENVTHVPVKVLAGMNQIFFDAMIRQGAGNWSGFDELWSSPDNSSYFHHLIALPTGLI
jgi:hypothetical protein